MRPLLASAAVTVALMLVAGPALAAPAVTLSRAAGPPTSPFTVSGTGFGANEVVDVFFDQGTLLRTVANGSGAFPATRATVPSFAAPGQHWIIARGDRSQLAASRAFTVRTDWVQEGRNGAHTAFNPFEFQVDTFNARDLDIAWSASTGGPPSIIPLEAPSPVVADGSVFVGSHDADLLYSFDAQTGARKWVIRTAGPVLGSPVVNGRRVIVGTAGGQVRAYSTTTQALLWRASVGQFAFPGLAGHGDRVYATGGGRVRAFPAACRTDGGVCAPIWSGEVRGVDNPTAPSTNGRDVVVAVAGGLIGFDANCGTGGATCTPAWTGQTGSAYITRAAATLAGGYAYTADDEGTLFAFPLRCGGSASCTPAWKSGTGAVSPSSPMVARGFVHVPAFGPLRVFSVAACAEGGAVCTPAWVGTGTETHVALAATPSAVLALAGAGRLVVYPHFCSSGGGSCPASARIALPAGLRSLPVVVDGRVYVHTLDGMLHMLDRSGITAASADSAPPEAASLETDESVPVVG